MPKKNVRSILDMMCSQIKFSLFTNCIFEVAIECHVEEAGPRTSCSPEKIFHLFYIFRLSLVGEAPFWPPRPFFGCNFWRPFPNGRKRRSYGADVILFWKSKVEEGEGRMGMVCSTWCLKKLSTFGSYSGISRQTHQYSF